MRLNMLGTALVAVMVSTYAYAIPVTDITNRSWILNSINSKIISLEAYQGKKPFIKFMDEQRFSAWAGCNQISGSFTFTEPDTLKFGQDIIMTKMACQTDLNVEDEFTAMLPKVQKLSVYGQNLAFTDADAKVLATFTELPNTPPPVAN